jgi:excisionase family DNA binding protein
MTKKESTLMLSRRRALHRAGEEFTPPSALARRFGVNRSTIHRWVERRILPQPFRFGGRVLFRRTEVEAIIRAQIRASRGA